MCHLFRGVYGQRSFLIIITVQLFAGPGILCTKITGLFWMVMGKLCRVQNTTLPRTPKVSTCLQKIILQLRYAWLVGFSLEVQSFNYKTLSTSFSFAYSFIQTFIQITRLFRSLVVIASVRAFVRS